MSKKIKVLCIGVEHSCTRLVTGLLLVHPDIESVGHASVPSGGKFFDPECIMRDFGFELVVLVVRDRSSTDLSMIADSSMKNVKGQELSGKPLGSGCDLANRTIRDFLKSYANDLVIVSLESLVQHKELVLRQTFRLLGVDPEKYDFNRTEKIKSDWWEISPEVKDPNVKYHGNKFWPVPKKESEECSNQNS